MDLNNDVVDRRLRLGPLHQLHPGRSSSLISHYNRPHRSPPSVEFLSVDSIAFISGIALLIEFAISITRSVYAIEVSVVHDRISRSAS
jgi:hypothetical protein